MSLRILEGASNDTDSATFKAYEQGVSLPCTFQMTGAGAAEVATIQFTPDGGTTWEDAHIDGSVLQISDTNKLESAYGPGTYRVQKGVASASDIHVSYPKNP